MRSGVKASESQRPFRGLGEADAQARLKAEGYNELPQPDRRTPFRIAIEVLREPMLALLLGGGIVYLLLGDLKEAIILVAFATMSIAITVVQETRTERVLEALRDLTSPRALVVRDGERKRIAGRDVVRGDVIVLSEGDRVPADAVLLQCQDLQADESMLTGESVPVRKIARKECDESQMHPPGGDDLPEVFSGSLIVRGTGLAEVIAIGPRSEIGKIGQSLARLETEPPRLQAQTRHLVRLFAVAGGAVSVLAVLLYGIMRGGWLDAVLAGIALGMSMLPEEFPVVLTVFMAMGARRISQARVLTRRAAAIETLGSATVLCTDKTGTLTENRMTIVELRLGDGGAGVRMTARRCQTTATTAAVTAFQKDKGLTQDGVAGPTTLAAINTALAAGLVLDCDERPDRRVGPHLRRLRERQLDAAEALRCAERRAVERVQCFAAVEVADPADARVVVVRPVRVRAAHRPDRDVLEDGQVPSCGRRRGDAGVAGRGEDDLAVVPEGQELRQVAVHVDVAVAGVRRLPAIVSVSSACQTFGPANASTRGRGRAGTSSRRRA